MALIKYIADVSGNLTEIKFIDVSSGTITYSTTTKTRSATGSIDKAIQTNNSGVIDETLLPKPTVIIGGTTADEGKWAQLDPNGKWDLSLMPVGIGAEVVIGVTSEAVAAGTFCNIASTGIRLADNSAVAKNAIGFVLATFASAATATMYGISNKNTALTGLTKGSKYYLGTAGGTTVTPPTANNAFVQPLGIAESATELVFSNAMFGWVKTV
jgi:hypothetical protein